jgi:hypothetical protein
MHKKKNGGIRFLVDYRKLNSVITAVAESREF